MSTATSKIMATSRSTASTTPIIPPTTVPLAEDPELLDSLVTVGAPEFDAVSVCVVDTVVDMSAERHKFDSILTGSKNSVELKEGVARTLELIEAVRIRLNNA